MKPVWTGFTGSTAACASLSRQEPTELEAGRHFEIKMAKRSLNLNTQVYG